MLWWWKWGVRAQFGSAPTIPHGQQPLKHTTKLIYIHTYILQSIRKLKSKIQVDYNKKDQRCCEVDVVWLCVHEEGDKCNMNLVAKGRPESTDITTKTTIIFKTSTTFFKVYQSRCSSGLLLSLSLTQQSPSLLRSPSAPPRVPLPTTQKCQPQWGTGCDGAGHRSPP